MTRSQRDLPKPASNESRGRDPCSALPVTLSSRIVLTKDGEFKKERIPTVFKLEFRTGPGWRAEQPHEVVLLLVRLHVHAVVAAVEEADFINILACPFAFQLLIFLRMRE